MGRRSLFAITLTLAYCSIVYELALAQSMAALLGNTFLRYNVTIGLYLAALGAGAWLAGRASQAGALAGLVQVEWALSILGAAGPVALSLWDLAVFRASQAGGFAFRGPVYQGLIYAFDHGLIVAIGVLSGFELPWLMRLGGEAEAEAVLAVDYAGTLAGALAFPLLLFPVLGLPAAAASTGLLNAVCGLVLLSRARRPRGLRYAAYAGAVALCAALLLARAPVNRLVSGGVLLLP
ncbi:MAG: hypothetical protein HY554_02655 [Elusimicrobia bacterium]|nr:hypothetical protein [Elusimicrobiota bacterium]